MMMTMLMMMYDDDGSGLGYMVVQMRITCTLHVQNKCVNIDLYTIIKSSHVITIFAARNL
jgi:hypothetical protein